MVTFLITPSQNFKGTPLAFVEALSLAGVSIYKNSRFKSGHCVLTYSAIPVLVGQRTNKLLVVNFSNLKYVAYQHESFNKH